MKSEARKIPGLAFVRAFRYEKSVPPLMSMFVPVR